MRRDSFLWFPVRESADPMPASRGATEIPLLVSGHSGPSHVSRLPAPDLFEGDRQAKRMNREFFE